MSNFADKGGPDQDLPDEQQLDEYLRGGSAVSRQYRQLPSADVPAEIDCLVLRQAQEAVKSRPAKSRKWMRWTAPLALAASAVLVLSIVIESGVHEEPYLIAPASAPAEVATKQAAAEVATKQEAAEEPAAGSAAEKRARQVDDASVVHVVPIEPVVIEDAAFAPPPASIELEAPAAFQDRTLGMESSAPQALARSERANAISQTAVTPPPIPAPAPAPAASVIVTESLLRERDMTVPQAVVTATTREEQKQTAGPRNTVKAPAAADVASSAEADRDEPRNYSDPEQWLRDIRELRKEKKHDEADREWRRFRYVFPNYEVAEDDAARAPLR